MADERRKPPAPSRWEWFVAAVGAVLLVATLAFLLHDALSASTPAQPAISILDVQRQQGRYVVRLRVDNAGERTAARLRLHATLSDAGTVLEEAETEFDYVPGRSSREAGLFFRNDPRVHTLQVVPRSYQEP